MTVPFWTRSKTLTSFDFNTDVAIVGGGFVGLSVAYWLTELRPELKVVIVERSQCGAGASGRNAGFLTIGSAAFYKSLTEEWGETRAKEVHDLAVESLKLVYERLIKDHPIIGFEKSSSMTLFQSQKQFDDWQLKEFIPESFGFQWREPKKLPNQIQSKFLGAFENGPEYKINPTELLGTLKSILNSRQVEILEANSAFKLNHDGVETEHGSIRAKKVVLALNGYFPEFHSVFKGLIEPKRGQMLAVRLDREFECPHLYYDPHERVYWRKGADNVLLIGGKRLLDPSGEVGSFDKVSETIQNGLEHYLKEQLSLKYKILNRWSGVMGFTGHELPLSGKIDAAVETYIIGGFSGHGMGLGFSSAQDLAKVIISEQKESFFERFKRADFKL